MKTIEEYLNDAVKRKSEFSNDFKELMLKYKQGDCVTVFVESVIEEAMQEYAKQCCRVQIIACSDVVPQGTEIEDNILNTPNVVTTKP